MPQPDDSGVLANSTPPADDPERCRHDVVLGVDVGVCSRRRPCPRHDPQLADTPEPARPVRTIGGPDHDGLTGRPAQGGEEQLSTEDAAEPAGDGPGWTRCGIEHLAGMIRAYARTEKGEMPVTVNDAAEVTALLADRDLMERDLAATGRLNGNLTTALDRAERERDHFRRELAEARAELTVVEGVEEERDRMEEELVGVRAQLDRLRGEVDTARRLVKEVAQDRDDAQDKVEGFPGRLATARRDAAADALEHAAGIAKRIAGGEEVYRDLCIASAQVRMGQRAIPARGDLGQGDEGADDGQR